jgi:hypothetical protein
MSAYPYVRELGMDEFVGAHHQTRSLFSAIDKYGHVETIDGDRRPDRRADLASRPTAKAGASGNPRPLSATPCRRD